MQSLEKRKEKQNRRLDQRMPCEVAPRSKTERHARPQLRYRPLSITGHRRDAQGTSVGQDVTGRCLHEVYLGNTEAKSPPSQTQDALRQSGSVGNSYEPGYPQAVTSSSLLSDYYVCVCFDRDEIFSNPQFPNIISLNAKKS